MTERERVEDIRRVLGFKKKEFSQLLGFAYQQNYSSYLNGKTNLSINMLRAIKEHSSDINTDWILSGKGRMLISDNEKIINGDGNTTQIGHNNKSSNNNNSNIIEVESLKKEIKSLNRVIESKDAQLKDKERLIFILEKNQK